MLEKPESHSPRHHPTTAWLWPGRFFSPPPLQNAFGLEFEVWRCSFRLEENS